MKRGLLRAALAAIVPIASAGWIACAHSRNESPSGSASLDALLPSGRNLFAFDFAQSRYQKWPLASSDSGMCRVLDTLAQDWSASSQWLALAAPSRPFAPMAAVWGPSGNFFLLDRAGKRLLQLDSNAQFLSGSPLPPEIRDRNLDPFEAFWTRDGLFSFADLGEGKVWQYDELRTPGGQSDWRLRDAVRLPLGLEACLWEPYFRNPCCLRRDGGALRPQCFDAYFNPTDTPAFARGPGLRAMPAATGWILRFGDGCARPPMCFSPEKGTLSGCPAEANAGTP